MLGSKFDLEMHIRNLGYTLPLKIGVPKPEKPPLRNIYVIYGIASGGLE